MNILGQNFFSPKIEISRCAGIVYDRTPETEIGCRPGGGIDAHMAHGATDHNAFDTVVFKTI
jgi:hypothetical protein